MKLYSAINNNRGVYIYIPGKTSPTFFLQVAKLYVQNASWLFKCFSLV